MTSPSEPYFSSSDDTSEEDEMPYFSSSDDCSLEYEIISMILPMHVEREHQLDHLQQLRPVHLAKGTVPAPEGKCVSSSIPSRPGVPRDRRENPRMGRFSLHSLPVPMRGGGRQQLGSRGVEKTAGRSGGVRGKRRKVAGDSGGRGRRKLSGVGGRQSARREDDGDLFTDESRLEMDPFLENQLGQGMERMTWNNEPYSNHGVTQEAVQVNSPVTQIGSPRFPLLVSNKKQKASGGASPALSPSHSDGMPSPVSLSVDAAMLGSMSRPIGRERAKFSRLSGESVGTCVGVHKEELQDIAASRHELIEKKRTQVEVLKSAEQRRQNAEDERIMLIDLSTMDGDLRDYYQRRRAKILARWRSGAQP